LAIYIRKEQKKAAEIDNKKWLKIPQISYLHPKGAEEGCRDRHQKMAKNSPNWLFTLERSRRRLRRSTKIKWLKIPQIVYLHPKGEAEREAVKPLIRKRSEFGLIPSPPLSEFSIFLTPLFFYFPNLRIFSTFPNSF